MTKRTKKSAALEAYEQDVINTPDHYIASIFKGVGKFERRQCATLELARTAALALIDGGTRPAIIYAVKGARNVPVEVVAAMYPKS